jgi:hypothetical protein
MHYPEAETALKALVAAPYDPTAFAVELAAIYNAPKTVQSRMKRAQDGRLPIDPADSVWKAKLRFRPAPQGRTESTLTDLLTQNPKKKAERVRFLLTTDGHDLCACDTKREETLRCTLTELPQHVGFFEALTGKEKYTLPTEHPADVKAAKHLAKIYDAVIADNPEWKDPKYRHNLNTFLARLLFCLYAEDTGIFGARIFEDTIGNETQDDGANLRRTLEVLFDDMRLTPDKRTPRGHHPPAFPFVNGGLFADATPLPKHLGTRVRKALLDAAKENWSQINPDIFGSMIQAVADPAMRGELGMHYTSSPNILRVLEPLFLDALRETFREAKGTRYEKDTLRRLHERMAHIRVFDPACGSGNFLIIAYKALRRLEADIYKHLGENLPSRIPLSNFYGIEMDDFAAETAKLSLHIAKYQMDKELIPTPPDPLPLHGEGRIMCGNALTQDWAAFCPPAPLTPAQHNAAECDLGGPTGRLALDPPAPPMTQGEVFICGNPPYCGRAQQTEGQKEDLAHVFAPVLSKYKNLDYVAAWFMKAAAYLGRSNGCAGFVSTNSICQGQIAGLLWPLLWECGVEIGFAHKSFKWKNLAGKNAGVTCIVVGIRPKGTPSPKQIFVEGQDKGQSVSNIGPYLLEMNSFVVREARTPLNGLPEMTFGNMPYGAEHLLLHASEHKHLIEQYPESERLMRRTYGSQEFIKNLVRYCLWIEDADLPLAQSIPPIAARIKKTEEIRSKSTDKAGRELAKKPHQFREMHVAKEHAIIVPAVTSETRKYLQIGVLTKQEIITNRAFAIYDAPLWVLALLSTTLHRVWAHAVGGKLEERVNYGNTTVYNTFPVPFLGQLKGKLEQHADTLLQVRENYINRQRKTIADLYNPAKMPPDLRAVHEGLDAFVEGIYAGRRFRDDADRLERLFKMYEEMTRRA